MNEKDRRSSIFRFETLLQLLDHYSDFLTAQQMEAVIRDSARIFVERDFVNEQQTRLEFIKNRIHHGGTSVHERGHRPAWN